MNEIGTAKYVLVVLDRKYIQSEYCMYELYQVFVNSGTDKDRFLQKLHLVVLPDSDLYNSFTISEYLSYWKSKVDSIKHANDIKKHLNKIYVNLEDILLSLSDKLIVPYEDTNKFIDKTLRSIKSMINSHDEFEFVRLVEVFRKDNLVDLLNALNRLAQEFPESVNLAIGRSVYLLRKGKIDKAGKHELDSIVNILYLGLKQRDVQTYTTIYCLLCLLKIEYYDYARFPFPVEYSFEYDSQIESRLETAALNGLKIRMKRSKLIIQQILKSQL